MRTRLSLALILAAAAVQPLAAQTDDGTTFRWSAPLASGRSVRVHNMNGDIRVERGEPGSKLEVVAERHVRRGDPGVVRFDVKMRSDGDAVVCALWGKEMQCTDDGIRGSYQSSEWRRSDEVDVVIRVRVPDGVKTLARSTNGSIAASGLASEVDAATTNGDVNVRTSGAVVNATTTNGSVTVALGTLSGDAPMRFSSTNGSVTVYAPPSLSADIDLSTTNGALSTEFPLTVSGRFTQRSVRGTLGTGGRSLVVHTTNGDIALKRNGI